LRGNEGPAGGEKQPDVQFWGMGNKVSIMAKKALTILRTYEKRKRVPLFGGPHLNLSKGTAVERVHQP